MKELFFLLFVIANFALAQPFQVNFAASNYNAPSSVIEKNGYYYVAGTTKFCHSCTESIYLLKIDGSGNVISNWTYPSSTTIQCSKMRLTPDGGFIFVGDSSNWSVNPFVLKIDSLYNVQWRYTNTSTLRFNDVVVLDSSYVVTGTLSNAGHAAQYLKLNSSGGFVWSYSYPVFAGLSITKVDDGFVSCSGYDTLFVNKIDSSGNFLWTKIFPDLWGWNTSIYSTSGNKTFISGGTNPVQVGGETFLLCLNDSDSLWTRTYAYDSISYASSINVSLDGNLLISGNSFNGVNDFIPDVFMMLTDTLGNEITREIFIDSLHDHFSQEAISLSDSSYMLLGTYDLLEVPKNFLIKTGTILSVSPLETDVPLSIYPNPASSKLFISSTTKISQLKIFDLIGKELFSLIISDNKIEIDIHFLSSDIYFLTLQTEHGTLTRKLVKQ